jgi:hypothetical protein
MKILALDLARNTGFALGDLRDRAPTFGSIRFGSVGASHQALFAAALTWGSTNFRIWRPDQIVTEAPMQMRLRGGASRSGNDEIAHGLQAIMMAVAYLLEIYGFRKAETRDVRMHFLGESPKRAIAKRKTIERCRMLKWNVTDDNQADACAIWSYACGLQNTQAALRPTLLFGQGA